MSVFSPFYWYHFEVKLCVVTWTVELLLSHLVNDHGYRRAIETHDHLVGGRMGGGGLSYSYPLCCAVIFWNNREASHSWQCVYAANPLWSRERPSVSKVNDALCMLDQVHPTINLKHLRTRKSQKNIYWPLTLLFHVWTICILCWLRMAPWQTAYYI